jgi:hypothetical protein
MTEDEWRVWLKRAQAHRPVDILAVLKVADDAWLEICSTNSMWSQSADAESNTSQTVLSDFKGLTASKGVIEGGLSLLAPLNPLLRMVDRGKPDYELVRCVRQCLSVLRKVTLVRKNPVWAEEAVNKFLQTNARIADVTPDVELIKLLRERFAYHFSKLQLPQQEWFCHGNGATACTTRGAQPGEKWNSFELDRESLTILQEMGVDVLIPALYQTPDKGPEGEAILYRLPVGVGEARTSILCCVPKDATKFRLITLEPPLLQWLQHGFAECLWRAIKASALGRRTNRRLNGRWNQRLARLGSYDGSFATIDLSSASDSISWLILRQLLADCPQLLKMCAVCRSRYVDTNRALGLSPGSTEPVQLFLFAGMGNAMTFPIECILFGVICECAILMYGDDPDKSNFAVHGDDIAIEQKYVDNVIRILSNLGFIVNVEKSYFLGKVEPRRHHGPFIHGKPVFGNFRESCGADYLDGTDFTVARLPRPYIGFCYGTDEQTLARTVWPVQAIAVANRFYEYGLTDVRNVIVRALMQLPQELQPMFCYDGLSGLMSSQPTNFHLAKADGPVYGGTSSARKTWQNRGYTSRYVIHGCLKMKQSASRGDTKFRWQTSEQRKPGELSERATWDLRHSWCEVSSDFPVDYFDVDQGAALYECLRLMELRLQPPDLVDSGDREFESFCTYVFAVANRRVIREAAWVQTKSILEQ